MFKKEERKKKENLLHWSSKKYAFYAVPKCLPQKMGRQGKKSIQKYRKIHSSIGVCKFEAFLLFLFNTQQFRKLFSPATGLINGIFYFFQSLIIPQAVLLMLEFETLVTNCVLQASCIVEQKDIFLQVSHCFRIFPLL